MEVTSKIKNGPFFSWKTLPRTAMSTLMGTVFNGKLMAVRLYDASSPDFLSLSCYAGCCIVYVYRSLRC